MATKKSITCEAGTAPGRFTFKVDANYWDGKKYRVFSSKDHISVFSSRDIMEMFNSDAKELGYYFILLASIDSDNMIGIYNNSLRKYKEIKSKAALYDLLGIKSRTTGSKFLKKLRQFSIIEELINPRTKETTYFLNPLYTMHDRGISLRLYKLFKSTLDRVLPFKTKMALQALCSDAGIDNSTRITYDKDGHLFADGVLIQDEAAKKQIGQAAEVSQIGYEYDTSKSQDEHMEIFRKTVLHGKAPQYVQRPAWGTLLDTIPSNNTEIFFLTQISRNKTRQIADICTYRNISIDIDAGKDSDGNYIQDIEKVEERKQLIMSILRPYLPTPSAIVISRDGFHIHWACTETEDQETWLRTAKTVADILGKMIDSSVTCNANRVLRMPGTIHHKPELEPYQVALVETNDVTYDYESLTQEFEAARDGLEYARDEILKAVPDIIQKTTKCKSGDNESRDYGDQEQSARIAAISSLSMDTFVVPDICQQMTKASAKKYIKDQDLRDFLQMSGTVCCINPEHDDHHPSATVYEHRYYCHCIADESDNHGYDIIDVVSMIADCGYSTAISYLSKIYGLEIIARKAA